MSRRALVAAWCAAVVVAGVALVALALVLGGGAPPPAPPGLADAGRVPAWIGDLVAFVVVLVGVATVGFGLLGSGLLDRPWPAMRTVAAGIAGWWASLTIFQFGLLSDFWPHGEVARLYGVFDSERGFAIRGTFIIDKDGVVRWKVVNPTPQARDLTEYSKALAALG